MFFKCVLATIKFLSSTAFECSLSIHPDSQTKYNFRLILVVCFQNLTKLKSKIMFVTREISLATIMNKSRLFKNDF